ncbi:probable basic-leucine zipper transcription factor N isoform X2 [Frankliniella occidentalis]|uniref:Probable basic-leucine zipper transcription factor N isoform X2 n=1 Tax=Frankliniella occidentalis TaxID=133901 RepID=A0A9C6TST8_FRAOC|nr:probable basic-leucine zipper transcription factor N isoform X2 [Frankliniella occidentalis]
MEYGWRGSPSQLPQQPGPVVNSNTAVQRLLQEQQQGKADGLKKVTWPPPPEDIADGEQEPVYAQEAPAVNGFVSPVPQYAQQVSRPGRSPLQQQPPQQPQQLPQTPPAHRRSGSRDRRSPAWTPPPTFITLRQSPPIHQEPAPVVVSQPATAIMQAPVQNGNGTLSRTNSTPSSAACSPIQGVPGPGGVSPKPTRVTAKNRGDLKWPPEVVEIIPETIAFEIPVARMEEPIVRQSGVRARGDAKWPPQEYKSRADEENAQRLALAKGPVCRPRLPKRDYTSFFDQNRVNAMYPGYRAPPGTQHYVDETGVSEF